MRRFVRARVGDGLDVALRHMAADAVIGRLSLHSRCQGQLTALVRMATEAFARKVGRRLFARRLHMRIVASDASHATGTRAIALAQGHGIVVLDVVCRGRRLRKRWNHQDRKGVVEWTSRTKILVSLAGLENAHIASLMAAHADVVCEIRSETSWINDLGIGPRSVLLRLRSSPRIRSGYVPRRGRGNFRSQWPIRKTARYRTSRWFRSPASIDHCGRKCSQH